MSNEILGIDLQIEFPDVNRQMSLGDIVYRFAHHRGFNLASSYCVIECLHPHIETWNNFTVGTRFTVQYGRDGRYTPKFPMEIFSVGNAALFSNVCVRIVGVEPGFKKLLTQTQMRSFQNQKVSDVIASIAGEAGIKTNILPTQGTGTFIQPKITNLDFITTYLLPISMSTGGQVPYLMTVDNNTLFYKPPTLNQRVKDGFVITPGIDTIVKHFAVKNKSTDTDLTYGTNLKTFGYDFVSKGLLTHNESTDQLAAKNKLGRFPYESNFSRQMITPYDQPWMLQAITKNAQGKGQFIVEATAITDGQPDISPDQLYQFVIPSLAIDNLLEYSAPYYVYHISQALKLRSWQTHLTLKLNSFLKNQKPGA